MSFKASSDTLFKDFSEAGGYNYLISMVMETSTTQESSEKQVSQKKKKSSGSQQIINLMIRPKFTTLWKICFMSAQTKLISHI